MPTLKIQKADGTFEFLQLAGEEFADIGHQVIDVKSQLAHTEQQVTDIAITNVDKYSNGNDSTMLNNFFSANAGKTIKLPAKTYNLSSAVVVQTDTVLDCTGVTFVSTNKNSMLLLSSGVKIKNAEFSGSWTNDVSLSERAIEIIGTIEDYKKDILIENCTFSNLGGYGIYSEFANNVEVVNCKMKNLGYAGIMAHSATDFNVKATKIKNVTPGVSGDGSINAYGISFNRFKPSQDLNLFPRSKDCVVDGCTIEDIPIWEGLDTHAGENIKFVNNTVRNCRVGIAIVGSSEIFSPINCTVENNTIYGNGNGNGIVVAGARNLLGNPHSYAENCIVANNTIVGAGTENDSTEGGIRISVTHGCIVTGNTLINCFVCGINAFNTNRGFVINGNAITDVQSSVYTQPACIMIRDEFNFGMIEGNTLLRVNPSLNTFVSVRGIRCEKTVNIEIGLGNNYITTTNHMSGVSGQHVYYQSMGVNSKMYMIDGSPLNVISAPVGSICINRTGSSGTTFFVKESGTGSSGWVAK